MDKKLKEKLKKKLEEARKKLEGRLDSLGKRNKKVKGDWITSYPEFDGGNLEEEADEVEEYGNLLSVGYTLKLELKKINNSLEKMKKGQYGICEKCQKPISQARLKAYPQAAFCKKCQE